MNEVELLEAFANGQDVDMEDAMWAAIEVTGSPIIEEALQELRF